MTMKVGLLCGREYSFPPAFIDRVNTLGRPHGITAEFVKLTGTQMGEPSGYRVIVDRISHEVEYFRAYLKHAVLEGTYVINNPFWWTADDKFFNYSVARKLGVAVPKTVLLPQKSYPADIDLTAGVAAQPRLPDRLGRAARLRRASGDPEAVFRRRLEARLQGATTAPSCSTPTTAPAPYCMTLQEFIHFNQYVRCFTFGKNDIMPVAYDPHQRRYLVEHEYLSPELGARIVRDAQTLNNALGYEMNTIEFAVQDGVPYAIDFLNPAPDFERDRITPFYFDMVVQKMADLVIDRALHGQPQQTWPRWAQMVGLGAGGPVWPI